MTGAAPEGQPARIWRLSDLDSSVAPSQFSPWRTALAEGARFTRRQLAVMREMNIDPDTVETITVLSRSTDREVWAPIDFCGRRRQPDIHITCPVLGRTPAGRVKVISPAGTKETVHPDGRVMKPKPEWGRH